MRLCVLENAWGQMVDIPYGHNLWADVKLALFTISHIMCYQKTTVVDESMSFILMMVVYVCVSWYRLESVIELARVSVTRDWGWNLGHIDLFGKGGLQLDLYVFH